MNMLHNSMEQNEHIHSDLVYPNSLLPIKMVQIVKRADYRSIVNLCKLRMIEEVIRKCVQIVRHTHNVLHSIALLYLYSSNVLCTIVCQLFLL